MNFSNIKYLIFVLVFCLLIPMSFSQERNDSLLKVALMDVYENPEKAIEIGNVLLKDYDKNPEKQIQVLQILTNAYWSLRNYEKSLETILQAKNLSQNLDNQVLQYQVLVKIANQYHSLGVNTKALEILEEADRLIESLPMSDSLQFGVGSNYAIRGFIYRNQLSCDLAIDYFNKAYKSFSSGKDIEKVKSNQSVVLYNKGNCFITLNKLDSAKINFQKSENYASQVQANSLRAYSLKGLAEVYTLESNYEEAIQVLIEAKNEAKSVGDLVLNRAIYKGLSDNNLALNNWREFQDYYKKHSQVHSEIKKNERQTINKLIEKHQEEVKSKSQNLKNKYGILILSLGLILIGFIIWITKTEVNFQKRIKKLKSGFRF